MWEIETDSVGNDPNRARLTPGQPSFVGSSLTETQLNSGTHSLSARGTQIIVEIHRRDEIHSQPARTPSSSECQSLASAIAKILSMWGARLLIHPSGVIVKPFGCGLDLKILLVPVGGRKRG